MVTALLAAAAAAGTPVGVAEREFSLALYRTSVPPGVVRLNVRNFGEDPHDVAVRGPLPSRRTLAISEEILPSHGATVRVRLRKAGRYEVLCTLGGHARLGMRQTLTVRRPKPRRR
jgi:plastocyanin